MLICFGISWPISIAKSVRTKIVIGKSPIFMAVVSLGYLSGIVHKVLHNLDWGTVLYLLNMTMVLIDLLLYFRYSRRNT